MLPSGAKRALPIVKPPIVLSFVHIHEIGEFYLDLERSAPMEQLGYLA